MRNIFLMATAAVLYLSTVAISSSAPRQMENLDRGVVAIHRDYPSSLVYVGWRMLGTEPNTVGYNVYRNGTKLNGSPITGSCNYLDSSGNAGSTYSVAAVIGGVEQELSDPVGTWTSAYLGSGQFMGCQQMPLEPRVGYLANDASVGDLDGDGDYELVIKRLSTDQTHSSTNFHYLEAYHLDGTLIWAINLGPNNLFSPHEINPIVYDFDGDGKAEVALRTTDGTIDGQGTLIGTTTDYRSTAVLNSSYYMIDGPEFISMFDGETGAEIARVDYIERDPISQWGLPGMSDAQYGHRADKCMLTPAYLDGEIPSLVVSRGIYHKTMLEAWNFRNGTFTKLWTFNSDSWPGYDGQGNHNLTVGDVDGDGFDEIVYGQMTVDHDGSGLYTTGYGHGDAIHMGQMINGSSGLQIYGVHESFPYGADLRDASDGTIIWSHTAGGDTGRGCAAHVDADNPGYQMWDVDTPGTYDATTTNLISANKPNWGNFLIWWDGDLQRELLDGVGSTTPSPIIDKWNSGTDSKYRLLSLYNYPSSYAIVTINGSKGNPCISGDLIGDWREEAIYPASDHGSLYIYTTATMTAHRIYTLMHDSMYRTAIAWQCNQYNQPPHPSFYIGAGMSTPPTPEIFFGLPPLETNIVVNSNDSGAGSLRQAIADSISGGTVIFTNTLSGQTITLTSGQIQITNNVTIDASDLPDGITIDGDANDRIFEFLTGTSNTLAGMTLINGHASGSDPDNKGGAIYLNNATLTISNCTLAGNTADEWGGAIAVDSGVLTLHSSTISGNTAINYGGGVENISGTLVLLNTTVHGNASSQTGGGIDNYLGTVASQNSTITGNSSDDGGGIYNAGSLNLTNTIVSANSATVNPDIFGSYSGSNNLVDAGSPGLAPLGAYGGPTQTMPPLFGSPAIDAGTATPLITDQRGFARVLGSAVDIGAVESGHADPGADYSVVTTVADFQNGLTNNGVSLRDAITYSPGDSTITFANGLSGQTITLSNGQFVVDKNLAIDASSLAAGVTLDANASGRIFEFLAGTSNRLAGMTLINGHASGSNPDNKGGAIYLTNATLTISNCTLAGNTADEWGGAIAVDSGVLTLHSSTISDNTAANYGGGVENISGTLLLLNTTIHGNSSSLTGGGIDNFLGSLTLQNSTITGNTSDDGGGIYNAGSLNLTNTIVSANNATVNPNIYGSYSGANNLIDESDIKLATLGDYGGSTHTLPPLYGSSAIDAGASTPLATDQRGQARVAAPDIGAAEFQGAADAAYFWDTDWDGDGTPYGLEIALGLDPYTPDSGGPGSPVAYPPGIAFGMNPDATNFTAWVVYRSLDLMVSNSFVEIYRFDGPSGLDITNGVPVSVNVESNMMQVIDDSDPLPDAAYYMLGVEPSL